jgi:hypothetical protein
LDPAALLKKDLRGRDRGSRPQFFIKPGGEPLVTERRRKKVKKYWLIMSLVFLVGLVFYVPEGNAFHGMGPELKGPGYGASSVALAPGKSLDRSQAKTIFGNYLRSQNNPELRLGKIEEDDTFFKADVLNQDNTLVDIILINKRTGEVRSEC